MVAVHIIFKANFSTFPPKAPVPRKEMRHVAWFYIQGSDNTVLGRQPGPLLSAPIDAGSPQVRQQATPQGAIYTSPPFSLHTKVSL